MQTLQSHLKDSKYWTAPPITLPPGTLVKPRRITLMYVEATITRHRSIPPCKTNNSTNTQHGTKLLGPGKFEGIRGVNAKGSQSRVHTH